MITLSAAVDSGHSQEFAASIDLSQEFKIMHFDTEELELINMAEAVPSVSIIIPTEAKYALTTEAAHAIKLAADKARKYLEESYPDAVAKPVINKLEETLASIDPGQVKRSVAIYVSPVVSKVFYLEMPVAEKVVVNASFEIRDLVFAKQSLLSYLVLFVSGKQAKVFLSDNNILVRLKLDIPDQVAEYENEIAERVTNFSASIGQKRSSAG